MSGIRISTHDLRRTYITAAESCDIPAYALKAPVNHSLGNDVTGGYVQMQRVTDKLRELCGIAEPEGVKRLRRE